MRSEQEQVLGAWIEAVALERQRRATEPWGLSVAGLKGFQQARLSATHADLVADARWGPACRFFLEELYGPRDYAARDQAFARVVPALVRLFPTEVIKTVSLLLELHACSEQLDSAMAEAAHEPSMPGDDSKWDGLLYAQCWQAVGQQARREWQVSAVHRLGMSLDQLVSQPGLRQALRLMRTPARLAGLGVLQQFLENGFDTFRAMKGASYFLDTVLERELAWVAWLFSPSAVCERPPVGAGSSDAWLGQFPGLRRS